jgi:glutathione synthase
MRSLFVMDPIAGIDPRTDSTWALMLASQRRGWPVWWCMPRDLYAEGDAVHATARRLRLEAAPPSYEQDPPEQVALAACDLVWMRKDPPFDLDYLAAIWLLELAAQRTTVLNAPRALACANEKLFALRWPHLCPPTRVASDPARLVAAVQGWGEAVLKPLDGCGGRGVVRTHASDPNLPALADLLTAEGRRAALAQRYLPGVLAGDKRILLVEGEPLGWLNRVPGPLDHRANLHVGGRAEPCALTEADREVCMALGPTLRAEGLLFVGIDVIDGHLTEVNVTSPTGIQEADRFLGVSIEDRILDAALRRVRLGGPT